MTYTPVELVMTVRSKLVSRLCNTTVASVTTAPAESRTVPFKAAVACAQAGEGKSASTNAAPKSNVNTTIHRSYMLKETWRVIVKSSSREAAWRLRHGFATFLNAFLFLFEQKAGLPTIAHKNSYAHASSTQFRLLSITKFHFCEYYFTM